MTEIGADLVEYGIDSRARPRINCAVSAKLFGIAVVEAHNRRCRQRANQAQPRPALRSDVEKHGELANAFAQRHEQRLYRRVEAGWKIVVIPDESVRTSSSRHGESLYLRKGILKHAEIDLEVAVLVLIE